MTVERSSPSACLWEARPLLYDTTSTHEAVVVKPMKYGQYTWQGSIQLLCMNCTRLTCPESIGDLQQGVETMTITMKDERMINYISVGMHLGHRPIEA